MFLTKVTGIFFKSGVKEMVVQGASFSDLSFFLNVF